MRTRGPAFLVAMFLLSGCGSSAPAPAPAPSPPPPAAPGMLVALSGSGAISLDWPTVPRATSYILYLAEAGGLTPSSWSNLPGGRRMTGVSPPITVPGLANGSTVHAVVTAVASGVEGPASPEASATPMADCACTGWRVCNARGACVAPAGDGDYLAGADFHALSDHWQQGGVSPLEDVFLPSYHLPGVRAAVRARLASLAASGARVVKTQFWFTTDATTGPLSWAHDFPPSLQQIRNLQDYVDDVAGMTTPDGHPLELYLSNDWLGVADINQGSPATTLGSGKLSPAEYAARVRATVAAQVGAIRGRFRPDGLPAVTLAYLKIEAHVCATDDDADAACTWPGSSQPAHNMQWFLTTFYPGFVAQSRAAGILPSLYFQVNGHERDMLPPTWSDPWYPELDGHITMTWVYRGLRWMRDHGLPLPERIDFTTGVEPPVDYSTPATVLARVYDDARAVLPGLAPAPLRLGAAEAFSWADPALTRPQALAFPAERLLSPSLEFVAFWPQLAPGLEAWDLTPFLLSKVVAPLPSLPDAGFEAASAGPLPSGWTADPPTSSPAARTVLPDAHGGAAVLRFSGLACGAGCGAVVSPPLAVQAGTSAVVRFWARSDIPQSGGHPPAPDYVGLVTEVLGSSGGVVGPAIVTFGTLETGGAWRRFVGTLDVPAGVDAIRLRFRLQNAGSGIVDVDDLH